ncbi:hypothetical protein LCGC14_2539430 [marine sediment metagenome]|uniref:Uncharacterized protein n=2 Tax=marine sediment metagenome TaxID=412755 RepID=A0A0F9DJ77_9ZZZZ
MRPHIIELTEGRTVHNEDPRLSDLPIAVRVELHGKTRVVVNVAGEDVASLPLASQVNISASTYRERGT